MERDSHIERLIAPSLAALGHDVVRVRMSGSQRPVLQVMIERGDRTALTVDDCAHASRTISAILDVEDPIGGAYTLEVSSPGIDRPLVRPEDFARFSGFEAKIEMTEPIDGRRRFRGRLLGIDEENDNTVRIALEDGDVALPFESIRRAKLVLTDELIAAAENAERV